MLRASRRPSGRGARRQRRCRHRLADRPPASLRVAARSAGRRTTGRPRRSVAAAGRPQRISSAAASHRGRVTPQRCRSRRSAGSARCRSRSRDAPCVRRGRRPDELAATASTSLGRRRRARAQPRASSWRLAHRRPPGRAGEHQRHVVYPPSSGLGQVRVRGSRSPDCRPRARGGARPCGCPTAGWRRPGSPATRRRRTSLCRPARTLATHGPRDVEARHEAIRLGSLRGGEPSGAVVDVRPGRGRRTRPSGRAADQQRDEGSASVIVGSRRMGPVSLVAVSPARVDRSVQSNREGR